jgi:hypothetical protein
MEKVNGKFVNTDGASIGHDVNCNLCRLDKQGDSFGRINRQ